MERYLDEDIFNILKLYSGLKLYYTTCENKAISPKKTEYKVFSLNGHCIYDGIDTRKNVALYKCYYDDNMLEIPLKTDEDTFLRVSDEFLNQVLRIK